jgi:hypothetical protein
VDSDPELVWRAVVVVLVVHMAAVATVEQLVLVVQ